MTTNLNRRSFLRTTGIAATAGLGLATASRALSGAPSGESPYGYCLNTSTLRGHKLDLVTEIEIAARTGYDAVEPWMGEIEAYLEGGGKLTELRQRLDDLGLTVESAIGFAKWIVDDPEERRQGLEQARRDMDRLARIGGKRIAAPPSGATDQADLDLLQAARRYRALLELGDELGVVPQCEVWGFSRSLSRLGEAVFVCVEAGHPSACLLPDVYHIFKGGSDFAGLKMLAGPAIQVFHINDYPAQPSRHEMNDSHRVYPGDGVAPLDDILQTLVRNGCRCMLSLELFNPEYWKQDPVEVARTGLRKTQEAVASALS